MSKYIFVTGGVVSGLGKGITTASLGRLLIERGLKIDVLRLDPYLNIDYKTVNPAQFGEVFVTDDGAVTDLNIGHYERFLDMNLSKSNYLTNGKIYADVLEKERAGKYMGSTIQTVPHITSEIKSILKNLNSDSVDVVLVEVGGTVGDIEGLVFLEAIRQFEKEIKKENYLHIHCTLAPYLEVSDESKTRPTQQSVHELMSYGINPDIVVCRTASNVELSDQNKRKIAMFCNLEDTECVIHNPDSNSIYEVPLVLFNQGLDRIVCEKLKLKAGVCTLATWREFVDSLRQNLPTVNIAVVGKYAEVSDSYVSLSEAIKHAGLNHKYETKITYISSQDIEIYGTKEVLKGYHGIIVPNGIGNAGSEGIIQTAKYCRETKIPFFAIGQALDLAIIEFARNVTGLKEANSVEFNANTSTPVIVEEVIRLGVDTCRLLDGTLARRLYGMPEIKERHKNKFEFNNEYREKLEESGMVFSGINAEKNLVEIIEYVDHPFFMATRYFPELKSRPTRPHPLFVGFISQAIAGIKKHNIYFN